MDQCEEEAAVAEKVLEKRKVATDTTLQAEANSIVHVSSDAGGHEAKTAPG